MKVVQSAKRSLQNTKVQMLPEFLNDVHSKGWFQVQKDVKSPQYGIFAIFFIIEKKFFFSFTITMVFIFMFTNKFCITI